MGGAKAPQPGQPLPLRGLWSVAYVPTNGSRSRVLLNFLPILLTPEPDSSQSSLVLRKMSARRAMGRTKTREKLLPPPLPSCASRACLSSLYIACSAGIFMAQCSINCHSCIESPSWIPKVMSWNEWTPPSFFYLTPTSSGKFSTAPQTFSQRQRILQTKYWTFPRPQNTPAPQASRLRHVHVFIQQDWAYQNKQNVQHNQNSSTGQHHVIAFLNDSYNL